MSETVSRRTVLGGMAAVSLTGISGSLPVASAVQADVLSAGLGLSQAGIEEIYGPGSPGQSFMVYTDPGYGVELHIGFDNDAVDYIWMALGNEQAFTGLGLDDAWALVEQLMPSDVELSESWTSQETPGSLAQLETVRYTSRWLDDILARSSILVTILSVTGTNGMEALRGVIQVAERQ